MFSFLVLSSLRADVSYFLCLTRRDQSNCSVIELNQTQSNLIERLDSIGSGIESNRAKKKCVSSIVFDFRTQSNNMKIIQKI